MLITEELSWSDFSGGRRSVGSDEERGKAEVADMQATIFRGRGVAQKAARQAEQEWRVAGDNVPQPAAYMSLGERAARQESSSLNLQLPKARETKAQRKCRLEKEAADRLVGVDTEPQRQATAEAALLPLARAQGKTPSHRQPSCLATSLVRSVLYAKSGVARSTPGGDQISGLAEASEGEVGGVQGGA